MPLSKLYKEHDPRSPQERIKDQLFQNPQLVVSYVELADIAPFYSNSHLHKIVKGISDNADVEIAFDQEGGGRYSLGFGAVNSELEPDERAKDLRERLIDHLRKLALRKAQFEAQSIQERILIPKFDTKGYPKPYLVVFNGFRQERALLLTSEQQ